MANIFPTEGWLEDFKEKLNTDEKYAQIARNWEGDLCLIIEADETLQEQVVFYLDLWHGACRNAVFYRGTADEVKGSFVINAPYRNWVRVLEGKIHPIQALVTQKLRLKGNMAYLMRHIPTVMDFTRCAQEVTKDVIKSS